MIECCLKHPVSEPVTSLGHAVFVVRDHAPEGVHRAARGGEQRVGSSHQCGCQLCVPVDKRPRDFLEAPCTSELVTQPSKQSERIFE